MVQPIDISSVIYILPIVAFLLVAFIIFAVVQRLKLFENPWPAAFISFFIATLFVTVAGSIDYVRYFGAWIAILIVSSVFLLAIIGLFGKGVEGWGKGIGIAVIIVAILIFIISGLVVYSSSITPYLPGGQAVGSYSIGGFLSWWFYSPRVLGAVVLLIVSAIAAWILTRAK